MSVGLDREQANALGGDLMTVTMGIRRLVRRQISQVLPAQPLPSGQVDLLLVVETTAGVGVAAAARTLHLAGNSVSALVNQLVTAGLLRRATDPSDRRAAQLFLTPKASSLLSRWRDTRAGLVGEALARLEGADRQRIEQALAPLSRLLDELRGVADTR